MAPPKEKRQQIDIRFAVFFIIVIISGCCIIIAQPPRVKRGAIKSTSQKTGSRIWSLLKRWDHILGPDALKYIANACYEIQLKDKAGDEEIEFFWRRIAENKRALDNTLKVIESGVETMTLPLRLKELEMERLQLHNELKAAEARKVILTPEHIEFMLLQYVEKGEDE